MEHNAFVYHAMEIKTRFGKMFSLLYVSADKNDWPAERPRTNYIASYVYNFHEGIGEVGDIFLTSDNGALIRTNV